MKYVEDRTGNLFFSAWSRVQRIASSADEEKVFEGDHMSQEWTFELKRGRLEGRAFLDVVAFSISNQGDMGGCSAQWVGAIQTHFVIQCTEH